MPNGRRRYAKGRRMYKGKHQVGAGSGGHLVPILRAPAVPKFERMLATVGVPVQRFRQFRSEERLRVTPNSGTCRWYGVPEYMDFGTPMNIVDQNVVAADVATAADGAQRFHIKQTPNSCDLFDIYKNLNAAAGQNNTTAYGTDSRNQPIVFGLRPGVEFETFPYGTQSTQNESSIGTAGVAMVPTEVRITRPGMDYTMRTHINYDNLSSLDAFVEVYRLTYRRPKASYNATMRYEMGQDYSVTDLVASNQFRHSSLNWRYSANHPGEAFSPCPVGAGFRAKYHSPNFAGGMIRAYAHACLVQRMPAFTGGATVADQARQLDTVDLGPAAEEKTLNTAGLGSISRPEVIAQVVCHPKVDPCKVTPPTRNPRQLGFTLERVRAAQRIKPGDSCRFDLPNHGTRWFDFEKSHVGQLDPDVKHQFTGATVDDVKEMTPIESASIYYFRVWGDMIHSSTALDGGAETDFQTGSTSVMFSTQRVVWARLRPRWNTNVNPALPEFDTQISAALQEHINEETDAPMIVDRSG